MKTLTEDLQRHWVDSDIIQQKYSRIHYDQRCKDVGWICAILVECQNASESIDSVFILGYADNIKKLMLKLHDISRNVFWELRSPREDV